MKVAPETGSQYVNFSFQLTEYAKGFQLDASHLDGTVSKQVTW